MKNYETSELVGNSLFVPIDYAELFAETGIKRGTIQKTDTAGFRYTNQDRSKAAFIHPPIKYFEDIPRSSKYPERFWGRTVIDIKIIDSSWFLSLNY